MLNPTDLPDYFPDNVKEWLVNHAERLEENVSEGADMQRRDQELSDHLREGMQQVVDCLMTTIDALRFATGADPNPECDYEAEIKGLSLTGMQYAFLTHAVLAGIAAISMRALVEAVTEMEKDKQESGAK